MFPQIYPLTDIALSGLSHAEQVERLCDGGATLIQLREKNLPTLEFYGQARAALTVARQRGARVIVNDRVDIALALGADGVHLGQDDLPPEAARRLLGERAIIGFSTHDADQARQAVKLPVNYLAIGPIFNTQTKANPSPEVGLDGLRAVRQIVGSLPLVAIGGITEFNAQEVIEAGADAVALVSALLTHPHQITERTRLLFRSLSS
ncbi:MAG: thiamine-phosphate pyrophosphorylase [Blastocatellia bacterium]|nr:thiamine-phosphate pyrophosphorylase [Blastocatellia bacterium]